MNYFFIITFVFAFGAMLHLSKKIEKQLHQLGRGILVKSVETELTKYGQIIYEHYCSGNNIPPNWDALELEQQEGWMQAANAVIREYRNDSVVIALNISEQRRIFK
ncbi:hypothetical protein [Nostoc sp.]